MKNSDYWKQRFGQLEDAQHNIGVDSLAEIEKQYKQAQKEIESKIAVWYQRFADNNKITLADAKQWLTGKDLKEFRWDIKDYIKYGEENAVNGKWIKELENASAKFHISKLEALKMQTQQSLETMFEKQQGTVKNTMSEVLQNGYLNTAFELQKGFNVGFNVSGINQEQIESILSKPWAADEYNFSERIWKNKNKLISELHSELTRNVMLGEDPQKAIDNIAKKMNVSKTNAGRLVMTEEAYFSSVAQKSCFNDLDVEKYEIVATLDSHTSDICQGLDGQVFKMSEYEPGVTAPPFHVNCRSTTVPYFDDNFGQIGERAAKDEDGKTYYVPEDMKYGEWKKTFVDGEKISSSDVTENVKNYRSLLLGEANEIKRMDKDITVHRAVEFKNKIYISENVKLKPKQVHNINKNINAAQRILGIENEPNLPKIYIIAHEEMQTYTLASCNQRENIILLDEYLGYEEKVRLIQKQCVCPDDERSTYIHEFIHWKDSNDYIKRGNSINTTEDYKVFDTEFKEKCKKKLDELQKKGYNVNGISTYASQAYDKGDYDETYTEYRTGKILEGMKKE